MVNDTGFSGNDFDVEATRDAELLKRIPGSIGYFELNYAETQAVPYAVFENRSGAFVLPFTANVAADAAMKSNVSGSNFR